MFECDKKLSIFKRVRQVLLFADNSAVVFRYDHWQMKKFDICVKK